jgi:hypothetical protein
VIAIPDRLALKLLAAIGCALLLVLLVHDRNRWKAKTEHYATVSAAERAAHSATVANYRAAAEQARRADAENAARVKAEQGAINERTANDFTSRIAAARARADELRRSARAAEPIPALAEQRQCPAYPLPPEELLKRPVKTDFLDPSIARKPGSPPRRGRCFDRDRTGDPARRADQLGARAGDGGFKRRPSESWGLRTRMLRRQSRAILLPWQCDSR